MFRSRPLAAAVLLAFLLILSIVLLTAAIQWAAPRDSDYLFETIELLPPGMDHSHALALNDAGQVLLVAGARKGTGLWFIWSNEEGFREMEMLRGAFPTFSGFTSTGWSWGWFSEEAAMIQQQWLVESAAASISTSTEDQSIYQAGFVISPTGEMVYPKPGLESVLWVERVTADGAAVLTTDDAILKLGTPDPTKRVAYFDNGKWGSEPPTSIREMEPFPDLWGSPAASMYPLFFPIVNEHGFPCSFYNSRGDRIEVQATPKHRIYRWLVDWGFGWLGNRGPAERLRQSERYSACDLESSLILADGKRVFFDQTMDVASGWRSELFLFINNRREILCNQFKDAKRTAVLLIPPPELRPDPNGQAILNRSR